MLLTNVVVSVRTIWLVMVKRLVTRKVVLLICSNVVGKVVVKKHVVVTYSVATMVCVERSTGQQPTHGHGDVVVAADAMPKRRNNGTSQRNILTISMTTEGTIYFV